MTSIEGNRGEPRPRPPFPAVKGLFGKPTMLNNVETYANIAQIILNGAGMVCLHGHGKVQGHQGLRAGRQDHQHRSGRDSHGHHAARDHRGDRRRHAPTARSSRPRRPAVPPAAASPPRCIDTPIDYDNLIAIGSMMGSGGLIVMDEDNCMVDIAKFFLEFTVDESCGKCTPCRIGTQPHAGDPRARSPRATARTEDLDKLEELANHIKTAALCGLGQTAPNPVLSTLRYFRDEYEAHI